MTTYKHIIWDWNGTLFDDLTLCIDLMNQILKKRNLEALTVDRYHSLFTFPVINYYQSLGFDFNRDSFEDLSIEFITAYENHKLSCSIFEAAKSVLKAISDAGLTQSILSAYKQNTLEQVVTHYELSDFFVRMIGQPNIYAVGKVEQGRRRVEELNLPANQIVLIGDTTHDSDVARDLGIDCILISAGHSSNEALIRTGNPVISTIAELGSLPAFESILTPEASLHGHQL